MSENLPILHSESAYILQSLSGLLPNLNKMIAIFFDNETKGLKALSVERGATSPIDLNFDVDFDYNQIQLLRERGNNQNWLDESNLTFKNSNTESTQKEVFQEVNNSILLTKIKNNNDKKFDLYFLYFNKDATNFGLKQGSDILATSSKNIIENIVNNAILSARKQQIGRAHV